MPIQMFNWVSRPQAGVPGQRRRRRRGAASVMTLAMNAVAIWLRYRFRKKHQMVERLPT